MAVTLQKHNQPEHFFVVERQQRVAWNERLKTYYCLRLFVRVEVERALALVLLLFRCRRMRG